MQEHRGGAECNARVLLVLARTAVVPSVFGSAHRASATRWTMGGYLRATPQPARRRRDDESFTPWGRSATRTRASSIAQGLGAVGEGMGGLESRAYAGSPSSAIGRFSRGSRPFRPQAAAEGRLDQGNEKKTQSMDLRPLCWRLGRWKPTTVRGLLVDAVGSSTRAPSFLTAGQYAAKRTPTLLTMRRRCQELDSMQAALLP